MQPPTARVLGNGIVKELTAFGYPSQDVIKTPALTQTRVIVNTNHRVTDRRINGFVSIISMQQSIQYVAKSVQNFHTFSVI
jgi:hypothetical protein